MSHGNLRKITKRPRGRRDVKGKPLQDTGRRRTPRHRQQLPPCWRRPRRADAILTPPAPCWRRPPRQSPIKLSRCHDRLGRTGGSAVVWERAPRRAETGRRAGLCSPGAATAVLCHRLFARQNTVNWKKNPVSLTGIGSFPHEFLTSLLPCFFQFFFYKPAWHKIE